MILRGEIAINSIQDVWTTFKTIKVLCQMFAAYGLPHQIVSGKIAIDMSNGVKHTHTGFMKGSKLDGLPHLTGLRSTPNATMNMAPCKPFLGCSVCTDLEQ